jgi:hypothetical protein
MVLELQVFRSMTPNLMSLRDELDDILFAKAKQKLKPEVYQKFYMAY